MWQLCPIRNRPAVNHCCAVIVLNLVARYQLPDGSWSDLCARFVESSSQRSSLVRLSARSKRKRIAISHDSILRSPISCVLTKVNTVAGELLIGRPPYSLYQLVPSAICVLLNL